MNLSKFTHELLRRAKYICGQQDKFYHDSVPQTMNHTTANLLAVVWLRP